MAEPETIDVCSHGRPDHQELIRRLLDALGLGTHARSQTPQAVFGECLAEIERLRAERTRFQPADPPHTVLGVPWCGRCGQSLYSHDCHPPPTSPDTPPRGPESPSEAPSAPGQPEDGNEPQSDGLDPAPQSCWVRSSCGSEVKVYLHHKTGVPWPGIGEFGWCEHEDRRHRAVEIEVIE